MSNGQHGGYRTPRNPAPASGPGKLARRTDGGPAQKIMLGTGGAYGDRTDALQQERGAPMSQADPITPSQVPAGGGGAPGAGAGGPGFGDPTAMPDQPVTHGVDIGAGGGPEALGMAPAGQQPDGYLTGLLSQMSASDMTGTLAKLLVMAKQRGV